MYREAIKNLYNSLIKSWQSKDSRLRGLYMVGIFFLLISITLFTASNIFVNGNEISSIVFKYTLLYFSIVCYCMAIFILTVNLYVYNDIKCIKKGDIIFSFIVIITMIVMLIVEIPILIMLLIFETLNNKIKLDYSTFIRINTSLLINIILEFIIFIPFFKINFIVFNTVYICSNNFSMSLFIFMILFWVEFMIFEKLFLIGREKIYMKNLLKNYIKEENKKFLIYDNNKLYLIFKMFLLSVYVIIFIGIILKMFPIEFILKVIPIKLVNIEGDVINVLTTVTLIFLLMDKYKEWK